jgi:hypothetical protein
MTAKTQTNPRGQWPCCICKKVMPDDEVIFADKDGDTWANEDPPKLAWCATCLPAQGDINEESRRDGGDV